VSSKRLDRLKLAKRILKADSGASANEIVGIIKAHENRRPDTFKSIGQLLPQELRCKMK
jgi:hypothetical protein